MERLWLSDRLLFFSCALKNMYPIYGTPHGQASCLDRSVVIWPDWRHLDLHLCSLGINVLHFVAGHQESAQVELRILAMSLHIADRRGVGLALQGRVSRAWVDPCLYQQENLCQISCCLSNLVSDQVPLGWWVAVGMKGRTTDWWG